MTLSADAQDRPPPRRRHPFRHPFRRPHGASGGGGHYRYTRFVHVMKVLLPSLALVLLALVALWPKLTSEDSRFQLGFSSLSPSSVENLSMVNARYFGVDAKNKPFNVTADLANEQAPGVGIIELQRPKADFVTRSGAGVFVEADKGYYHQKEQLLELVGNVSLFHEDGYEVHSSEAEVDLVQGNVRGTKAVTGHGPQGRINGQGFEIRDEGREVTVTGQSMLVVKGAEGKKKK